MLEALKPQPADKIIELIGLYAADPRDRQGRPRRRRLQGRRGPHPGDARGQGRRGAAARRRRRPSPTSACSATSRFVDAMRRPDLRRRRRRRPGRRRADPGRHRRRAPAAGAGPARQPRGARSGSRRRPGRTTRRSSPISASRRGPTATSTRRRGGVDFAGMLADLAAVAPGDVVLLHGCCHNPTGANLSLGRMARRSTELRARAAASCR